jgi:hypothetical protein
MHVFMLDRVFLRVPRGERRGSAPTKEAAKAIDAVIILTLTFSFSESRGLASTRPLQAPFNHPLLGR